MKEALLIIDVQNDYFPGGSNELFFDKGIVLSVSRLFCVSMKRLTISHRNRYHLQSVSWQS